MTEQMKGNSKFDFRAAYNEAKKSDPINHPKHYTSHPSGVEAIEITQHYNFCVGNAIKYLWRNGLKDDEGSGAVKDLKKAIWYIDREIQNLENGVYNGKTKSMEEKGNSNQSRGGQETSGSPVQEHDPIAPNAKWEDLRSIGQESYYSAVYLSKGDGKETGSRGNEKGYTCSWGNGAFRVDGDIRQFCIDNLNLKDNMKITYNHGTYWAGTTSGWDIMINQLVKDKK